LVEGVDVGKERDLLWELMKEIVRPCQVYDYATKCGVEVQFKHISHRRYPTYEN
jgi:hypothetical protein